jgi:hypothetical protein
VNNSLCSTCEGGAIWPIHATEAFDGEIEAFVRLAGIRIRLIGIAQSNKSPRVADWL